jgi:hypothetical protein
VSREDGAREGDSGAGQQQRAREEARDLDALEAWDSKGRLHLRPNAFAPRGRSAQTRARGIGALRDQGKHRTPAAV